MSIFNFFIDQLLKVPFRSPDDDITELCRIWCDSTRCDWIWLWIQNAYTGVFELRKQRSNSSKIFMPSGIDSSPDRSVAQYCAEFGEVVDLRLDDFLKWEKVHPEDKQRKYRCISANTLRSYNCSRFICVPFGHRIIRHTESARTAGIPISASICLHFTNGNYPVIDTQDLRRLGELSSFFLENSYRSRNEQTLHKLYKIDSELAYTDTRNPKAILEAYCTRILKLLSDVAKSEASSLLLDLEGDGKILTFVGSTHEIKEWSSGKKYRDSNLKDATYRKGEGMTGLAFEKGELLVSHSPQDFERSPKYAEIDGSNILTRRTTAFIPLNLAARDSNSSIFNTVGVLRCVGRAKSKTDFSVDTFDQIDLESLQFFCEQIAPVLQSLKGRIEREKEIRIIKHDLVSPISHIKHIADDLETNQVVSKSEAIFTDPKTGRLIRKRTQKMRIPFRDLMNIKLFAIEASNLVYQLDPDLNVAGQFKHEKVLLEGDIIARLKFAMKFLARTEKEMRIVFEDINLIPPLSLDRGSIERVFYNLLANAIKYGRRNTTIFMKAFETTSHYCVNVSNYGDGISEADKDLIFNEEYRSADAVKAMIPGLGLGLYIAKRAIEKHGGSLKLTSQVNPTTFTVFFPISLRVF
jgi:hypothetical protein